MKKIKVWLVEYFNDMVFIPYQKGATSWGFQIGRVEGQLNFPRYWRGSGLGFIRLLDNNGDIK